MPQWTRRNPQLHNERVKRLVWLVGLTAAGALVAACAVALSRQPVPYSAIQYMITAPIPFLAAGIILLRRHPQHRAGWLLVVGAAGSMAYPALLEQLIYRQYPVAGEQPWMSWALTTEALVSVVGLACICLLIGLFPRGVANTAGERKFESVMWALAIPMTIAVLANEHVLVDQVAYGRLGPFSNPLHNESLSWLGPATSSMRYLLATAVLGALALLIFRYRRRPQDERRQIRWVLFGTATALAIGIVPFILQPMLGTQVHGGLTLTLGSIALMLIPISVLIAIEQPPWLDTDALIRKAFAYGTLSFGIFLVYGTVAAGLGLAAGARFPVEIAIVLTAVLAFAFQPARARLQRIADRWVYGPQPSPIEAVAEFDDSLRQSGAGAQLTHQLAETVRKAGRLRWVSVSIPPEPPAVAGEESDRTVLVAPIERGDERFGQITCGPKVTGTFKASDADLVRALAGQAALVVSHARLAARIVQAQEAERRRLERNLHDGAQQELVALVAKLGLARSKMKGKTLDEATLIDLQRDAGTILRDLRELAQGIHPSVLTDGGLVEAVEDRCSRLPVTVTVEATPALVGQRFGDDIEGAAYFFVTEGVTNVLKHSHATEVCIGIHLVNSQIELTVADNGTGFDPAATPKTGIAGLTDRFQALNGTVTLVAASGRGTVLSGRIPIEPPR